MEKAAIFNAFRVLPISNKSHARGWTTAWEQRIPGSITARGSTDLREFENIYFEHGISYNGILNLFSGINEDTIDLLQNMYEAVLGGTKLYSLDISMEQANYLNQIERKLTYPSTSKRLNFDLLMGLDCIFEEAKTLRMSDLDLTKCIIGDSHSTSFSMPDQAIFRNDGALLYSFLKKGMFNVLKNYSAKYHNGITLCFGSIDIRFHVFGAKGRMGPTQFADVYAREVIATQERLKVPISVCATVPVEHEGRKISLSGEYKGQGFFGNRIERLGYTMTFMERLDDYWQDFELIKPPIEWYTMDGESYATEMMESRQSVHIAPKYYRSVGGFDYA